VKEKTTTVISSLKLTINLNTCKLTKNPEWPKDFKTTTFVSQTKAIVGLFATFRPSRLIPGPRKPIDYGNKSQIVNY
jgi:hypothetical protein